MSPPRERFEAKVTPEPTTGCWLWAGAMMKNGYGRFGVKAGDVRQAHRYALELDGRPPASNQVVMHRCNNRACVNPAHLLAGTQKENLEQASREGRMLGGPRLRGFKNPRASFTSEQASEVKRRLLAGETRAQVARCFGVNWGTIERIASGLAYSEARP